MSAHDVRHPAARLEPSTTTHTHTHMCVQAEDLAGEVELGPAASRALWKWSCLQVAQQAARTGTPGGVWCWPWEQLGAL